MFFAGVFASFLLFFYPIIGLFCALLFVLFKLFFELFIYSFLSIFLSANAVFSSAN
jgi:hypothetical protein